MNKKNSKLSVFSPFIKWLNSYDGKKKEQYCLKRPLPYAFFKFLPQTHPQRATNQKMLKLLVATYIWSKKKEVICIGLKVKYAHKLCSVRDFKTWTRTCVWPSINPDIC